MNHKLIKITEVGPRDGLQNETSVVPTDSKLKFIELLFKSGVTNLESTSFVRADKIPQLSDAKDLSEKISTTDIEKCIALVPNIKGYENAIKCRYQKIALFTAASETFCKKNINMSIRESIDMIQKVSRLAQIDKVSVRLYISTVAHCPYEGYIHPSRVLEIIQFLEDIGAYEISLGDTIGLATPGNIDALLGTLFTQYPPNLFAGHFHDTYGFAISNVQKSLEMGLRSFDSSAGGLGGCPYARGASGNLATEDLLYFLKCSGYTTDINLEGILLASSYLEKILGKSLPSRTYRALSK